MPLTLSVSCVMAETSASDLRLGADGADAPTHGQPHEEGQHRQ
jgi:hypothetical protein